MTESYLFADVSSEPPEVPSGAAAVHPVEGRVEGESPHRHLIARHSHPEWHGHCDQAAPGYKPCDRPHWHFLWRHTHA